MHNLQEALNPGGSDTMQARLAALDAALLQLNAGVRLARISRTTWPSAASLGAAHRGVNQSSRIPRARVVGRAWPGQDARPGAGRARATHGSQTVRGTLRGCPSTPTATSDRAPRAAHS